MINKDNKNNNKNKYEDEVIKELFSEIEKIGHNIQNDKDKDVNEKTAKADVLLNTMYFLKDYNENIKVLNDYWLKKRYREKFNLNDLDK